jgi:mannose-6-phosphate isomerase class I
MPSLKLRAINKNYIWGGKWLSDNFHHINDSGNIAESWELSIHPDGVSYCDEEALTEYFDNHPNAVNANGDKLPIMIKYIDAKDNLSIQVHPTDDYAKFHNIGNGKTEMWYVIHAEPNAGIFCGFKKNTSKEELIKVIQNGTAETLLNFIPVKDGDCFLVKAGTIHSICKGCVICEVQQSSNTTYRVYDYNRKDANGNMRELHVEDALNVLNYKKYKNETNSGNYEIFDFGKVRLLTECQYFRCREWILNGTYKDITNTSFYAVNVIDGSGYIDGRAFVKGDSFFIPFKEQFVITGQAKILLTDIPTNGENS